MTKMDWEKAAKRECAASDGDTYVGVTVILRRRTAKAIQVSPEADTDTSAWIPRSCIHGGDDSAIDAVAIGDEVSLRMFSWIANREGLV